MKTFQKLSVIIIVALAAVNNSCGSVQASSVELPKNTYVIIKTENPKSGLEIFGIFRVNEIIVQSENISINYEYFYMSDDTTILNLESANIKMGKESTQEGVADGAINFHLFSADWSYRNRDSVWLTSKNIHEVDGLNILSHKYCLTNLQKLDDLINKDLKLFSCQYI